MLKLIALNAKNSLFGGADLVPVVGSDMRGDTGRGRDHCCRVEGHSAGDRACARRGPDARAEDAPNGGQCLAPSDDQTGGGTLHGSGGRVARPQRGPHPIELFEVEVTDVGDHLDIVAVLHEPTDDALLGDARHRWVEGEILQPPKGLDQGFLDVVGTRDLVPCISGLVAGVVHGAPNPCRDPALLVHLLRDQRSEPLPGDPLVVRHLMFAVPRARHPPTLGQIKFGDAALIH